ncbi:MULTISPECIES: ATP-binding protein [Rhodomicrobium]|uniref:sensor histidine kinase n=1 Tax=Rhodomicrobium TaxID=1068 RepID=UPI000B4BCD1E|nr:MULTISPECIES: ATP-binding protein [Rhodomicrobium]
MTGLIKLLRTTAFRYSLIYFGLFAAAAAGAVFYIYWQTNALLGAQIESAIQAEIGSLDQQYRQGGIETLKRAVVDRSETPGNSLYLLADAEGRHLGGNLKAVSEELWNSTGRVAFIYRRALDNRVEERYAFAVIFRLANGYRLVVGRDIEDRRQFGELVRSVFLWTLAGMAIVGLGGGLLVGRSLLRRVESMTETTRNIMAGDLSRRVPVSGSDDEFDRLAVSLNEMLKRIEELIAGFKEVSDNIAHDLKTPLSRLRNRVETALREPADPQTYRDALQATIEDADELIKTFDALLSIARLESGAAHPNLERFDLAAVVTDVCELYEPLAEERGMVLDLTPAAETIVEGKRELIAQAVANILDNAIKYGTPGDGSPGANAKTISVSLDRQPERADIVIGDRGPGVPPEDRERVFRRFVRLEASRSLPGSGLGLSLAAAVARLHGGTLTLSDNEPGLKATLSLRRLASAAEGGR